jgi:hypothetical protein
MKRLMVREDMADVSFLVEGKEVFANRAILAVRSDYFDVMLYGGMRESLRDEDGMAKPIELGDVSHPVFLKVIEYLYTDNVSELTWDISVPLLIASERFMLDRLKALCEDHIRKEITVDNVIGVLIASHRHNAIGLKDIALEFILRNLQDTSVKAGLSVSCHFLNPFSCNNTRCVSYRVCIISFRCAQELKSEPDLLVEIITRHTHTLASNSMSASDSVTGAFGPSSEWSGSRR